MQGYIEVEMRCDSPYSYSPIYTRSYDISTSEPTIVEFTNGGDLDLLPEMWITMKQNGDVTIENLTYSNTPLFHFTSLLSGESVYIDNENEIIETSLSETYRYSNFNNNYLCLKRGLNRLRITGNCEIQFKWQFKTLG